MPPLHVGVCCCHHDDVEGRCATTRAPSSLPSPPPSTSSHRWRRSGRWRRPPPPWSSRPHKRPAVALCVATALLLGAAGTTARGEVPPGLLFADELEGDPRPGTRVRGLGTEHTAPPSHAPRGGESAADPRERVHPVRRIYRDNAHVRRRMEEVENAMPYFRTGIRGDPNHIVPYRNHPFDVMRRAREERAREERLTGGGEGDSGPERLLQEEGAADPEDPFRPIRIHFDTAALDGELTASNGPQIEFVKNTILPRMAAYWSTALSVVPVEGNLLVSTAELQGRIYCGDTEFSKVPAAHISTGVPDADLVLYVSGAPSARFCGPSTLAVAVACNFDQFDRPTAGAINFCLDQIDLDANGEASASVAEDNVDVAVHEAAHVLGMSSNSYRFFWDPDTGYERTPRPFSAKSVVCVDGVERTLILPSDNTMKFFIATSGQRYASIVTPKVATVARNQFDCQELNGAQLENQPTGENSCTGDHWVSALWDGLLSRGGKREGFLCRGRATCNFLFPPDAKRTCSCLGLGEKMQQV